MQLTAEEISLVQRRREALGRQKFINEGLDLAIKTAVDTAQGLTRSHQEVLMCRELVRKFECLKALKVGL